MSLLEVENLYTRFPTSRGTVKAVDHVDLHLEQRSAGSWSEVRLDRTRVEFLADPEGDGIYVVVDTQDTGPENLKSGEYRLTFELSGVADRYDAFSTSAGHRGYPFLEPGATQSVSTVAVVAPPDASITTPSEESPHLNADGELLVGGQSSVAAESPLRVTAMSTEYAWETDTHATVNETGHWTASVALADAPGDEFTVSVSRGNEQFDERTYTVRPPPENSSDGGGSNDGGSGGGEGGPLESGGGILSSLSGLGGLAVPIGAGLGVLVALWAAWKLVIRRILI